MVLLCALLNHYLCSAAEMKPTVSSGGHSCTVQLTARVKAHSLKALGQPIKSLENLLDQQWAIVVAAEAALMLFSLLKVLCYIL